MRFITGDWLADTVENTLTNQRTREVTKLEPIMLRALYFFARNANKTISHQELIDNIWDGRVVTEHVVYRVVKVLRQALAPNDRSAYIKTIPKYGYKYIGSFQELEPTEATFDNDVTLEEAFRSEPPRSAKNRFYILTVVALLVASVIMFRQQQAEVVQFNTIKPLTTLTGVEKNPVYLTTVDQLLFTHQLDQNHPANVYSKSVSTGIVTRLTDNDSIEENLTASEDARLIAFTRSNNDSCDVILLSKTDSGEVEESRLFECNTLYTDSSDLQLSNDGRKLYYIYLSAGTHQIFSHSIATGKKTQITKLNQHESLGEFNLALSPDNSRLAFIRRPSWGESEIGIINIDTGKEKIIHTVAQYIDSLAWSTGGDYLYYVDSEQYINALSIKNKRTETVLKSLEPNIRKVYSSPLANSVIIEKHDNYTGIGIWQFANPSIEGATREGELIVSSEELDVYPSFSHNSGRIAFVSLRTGAQQIWIKEPNGEERRITNFTDGRSIDNLNWSLDDRQLLTSKQDQIYAVDVETGEETIYLNLTEYANYEHATWSASGKQIYFASDISGDKQVYSLNLGSGEIVQLTIKGAITAFAGDNPNIIFLLKEHHEGLWEFNLETGEEVLLFDDIDGESYDGVAVTGAGIYYYSSKKKIRFYSFEKKVSADIKLQQVPYLQQFSISRNLESIVFYNQNLTEASIVLATQ